MIFFTSDQHFFDPVIMKNAGRPFASADLMDRTIAERFNEATGDGDEVYMLGDFLGVWQPPDAFGSMCRMMRALGADRKTFHLMKGNHDNFTDSEYRAAGFCRVMSRSAQIDAGGHRFLIAHDPSMIQAPGTLAICGHVHTLFKEVWNEERGTLAINVGTDVRDYRPVSLDGILEIAARYPRVGR